MSSIVQYFGECLIGWGNFLTQLLKEEIKEANPTTDSPFTIKRHWLKSYFGEWPIRFENGGIILHTDPFFVVILSSVTSLVCSGLLVILYFFYCKRVWMFTESVNVPATQQSFCIPLDGRDNNYNPPPGIGGLHHPHHFSGATEIPDSITPQRNPGHRLSRRPAAVNIPTNHDLEVPPNPRIPFQEPHLMEIPPEGNFNLENPQPDANMNNMPQVEDCESFTSSSSEDIDIAEEKLEIRTFDSDDIIFHDIPPEDSDSSSQTEYDRYETEDDATFPKEGNGDHKMFYDYDQEKNKYSSLLDNSMQMSSTLSPDRVVLHQFQRGRIGSVPCLAPFAMKLETYLRMTEIEYDIVYDCDCTGPWLSFHDEKFKGVSSCLAFLKQVFPSQTENFFPSPDMKVVSWFISVLVEHHLYWGLIIWRWILNEGKDILHNQPNWNFIFADPKEIGDCVREGATYHGFEQLSYNPTDIKNAVMKDLDALSHTLGDKEFLTGTSPKEVDCSAFAILSQILWSSSDPIFQSAMQSFPNLLNYCDRMKCILWSDWDDIMFKDEECDTAMAKYNSSAEVTPLASPRSITTSNLSNSNPFIHDLKGRNTNPFMLCSPHIQCTETTEVFVRKTVTENQFWNLNSTIVSNIPNSLNFCADEYFDENLEDMESIKMITTETTENIVDPEDDNDNDNQLQIDENLT